MRVCSFNASHDLSEVKAWDKVCPSCGRPITEYAAEPPLKPPEPQQKQTEDLVINTTVVEPPADPSPAPAPVKLLCMKDPGHDLGGLMPGQHTCWHPGCGSPLMDVVCINDPKVHDLSDLHPASLRCPRCGGKVMRLVCTRDPLHDIRGREPGQMTCPEHESLLHFEDLPSAHGDTPGSIARHVESNILLIWLRHWWPLIAVSGAVLVLVVVMKLPAGGPPDNPCQTIPADQTAALAQLRETLAKQPTPAQIRIDAGRYLSCRRPELAVPALRTAADAGDGPAALQLGKLYDPSLGTSGDARLLPPRPEFAWSWYERALKNGDASVQAEQSRLRAWLSAAAAKGDSDAADILAKEAQ